MALERWLLEVAKQMPDELDAIVLDLLAKSDNGAITAVVASVATAFPTHCGETLLTLLSTRDHVMMDRHRFATESRAATELFGNLLAHRNVENRLYQSERKEADNWPHRHQDLEFAITQLQCTQFAKRVHKTLDDHRQILSNLPVQDHDDRLWRLAIHRMDLRDYKVSELKSIHAGPNSEERVYLELKDPEPDLKEMVDRSAPQFARMQNNMALLMWGLKVFKNEITPSDPDDWREKLASAALFEKTPATDPMEHAVTGAPAIIAAVCVRDHWQE